MKKILITTCILLILTSSFAFAHQPRLVQENFIKVENPEISQAFYGELKNAPAFFQINSQESFNLYVQILVPDIENISKNISVEISKDNQAYYLLDGKNFNWQAFYEEFAGDNYFQGPEFTAQAEPGTYNLKVFNQNNQGKYVLVIGKKEEFPFNEIINMLISMPGLKKFFNKSPFQALLAPIILRFLILPIAVLIILIIIIILLIKRKNKK